MIESLGLKLVNSLTEPVQFVLLLAIIVCLAYIKAILKINEKLLEAQQDRGITLTKLTLMIEAMFRDSRKGAE